MAAEGVAGVTYQVMRSTGKILILSGFFSEQADEEPGRAPERRCRKPPFLYERGGLQAAVHVLVHAPRRSFQRMLARPRPGILADALKNQGRGEASPIFKCFGEKAGA